MKRYKVINKFRFTLSMLIMFLIICIPIFTTIVNAKSQSNIKLIPVYIEQGDTLWALSKDFIDTRTDIREYIYTVMEVNNMRSPNLNPGSLIYFPHSEN